MRILIYGAGVIGSLYAALLSRYTKVTVLARGHRLSELRKKGLIWGLDNKQIRARVRVIDELAPEDCYDFIFLTVRAEQVENALAALGENKSPTILTMVNSIEPYENWEKLCGKGRILPAFPGAGGSIENGVLHARLTPPVIQPTTFGELNGLRTGRVRKLESLFSQAKIPYQRVKDMHTWQICHLAMVVPLADAYFLTDQPERVGTNGPIMIKTAEKLRRNDRTLVKTGIKLSPFKMNIFRFIPIPILG